MNECPICKAGTLQEGLVETWMRRDERWVLFRNVPALQCDECGEKVFTQVTAERLARMLDRDNREFPTSFLYTPVFDLAHMDTARTQGERPFSFVGTEELPRRQWELPTPDILEVDNRSSRVWVAP